MTKIEALRADLELRERLKAEWATIRTADLRALVDCASLAAQAQDILICTPDVPGEEEESP